MLLSLAALAGPRAASAALLAGSLLLGGCIVGRGEGWVAGSVTTTDCKDGVPLEAPQGGFDLKVDFYSGESLQDDSESVVQRQSRLTLRLQNTSNNLEQSDGLILQFLDVEKVARRFVAGEVLPVTATGTCTGGACDNAADLVRGRLYLYTTCPENREPLVASSRSYSTPSGASAGCQVPSAREAPSCPTLTAATRAQLDALCQGDFNSRASAETLRGVLGGGACLYLCRFGAAVVGQDPAALTGFTIEYGDRVAALFSLAIVDARAVELGTCAAASGSMQGMVNLEVRRGQSAQAFP